MPGYSGTPLAKKLGITEGSCVYLIDPPDNYRALFEALPKGVRFETSLSTTTQVAHGFFRSKVQLQAALERLRKTIPTESCFWVSWPKKSAKVPTDITEDVIRTLSLPLGWVDVKVCAVNDVWSGLKLVIRKRERSRK